MPEQAATLDTWAIVEVMGHKKYAGHLTEQVFGGASMFRVDVPATDNGTTVTAEYTKLIGVGSIYCITPCTEEVARRVAVVIERYNDPIPVSLPVERRIGAGVAEAELADDLDNLDYTDDPDGEELPI